MQKRVLHKRAYGFCFLSFFLKVMVKSNDLKALSSMSYLSSMLMNEK